MVRSIQNNRTANFLAAATLATPLFHAMAAMLRLRNPSSRRHTVLYALDQATGLAPAPPRGPPTPSPAPRLVTTTPLGLTTLSTATRLATTTPLVSATPSPATGLATPTPRGPPTPSSATRLASSTPQVSTIPFSATRLATVTQRAVATCTLPMRARLLRPGIQRDPHWHAGHRPGPAECYLYRGHLRLSRGLSRPGRLRY